MSNVTYDGEEVVFNGPPPANLSTLVDILTHNAANDKRVLISVKVDGQEVLGTSLGDKTVYKKVDVLTGTEKQLYLKAIDTTLKNLPEADTAIDPILETLLSDTWENAFAKLNSFLQGLNPYFELLATLAKYGQTHNMVWQKTLGEQLKKVDEIFSRILKQCETQQVAELTSLLNFEFRPLYVESVSTVKNVIRPTLQS